MEESSIDRESPTNDSLTARTLKASGVWAAGGTALTATSAFARLFVLGYALSGPEFVDALFLVTVLPTIATIARLGLDRSGPRLVGVAIHQGDYDAARSAFEAALLTALGSSSVASALIIFQPTYDALLGPFLATPLDTATRIALAVWFASEVARTPVAEIARVRTRFGTSFIADSGIRNTIFAIFLLALTQITSVSLATVILVAAATNALVVGTAALRIVKLNRESAPRPVRNRPFVALLRLSPSLLVTLIGALLLASGDLWVVSRVFVEDDRAAYLVGFQVASLFAIVMTVENMATQPYIARLIQSPLERDRLTSILRVAATIGLAVATLGMTFFVVVWLLLPDQIGQIDTSLAATVAFTLAAGQWCSVGCGPCGTVLIMSTKVNVGTAITLVTGAVVVLAEIVVAQHAPIWAVAIVSGGGVVALNLALSFASVRQLGVHTYASIRPRTIGRLRREALR